MEKHINGSSFINEVHVCISNSCAEEVNISKWIIILNKSTKEYQYLEYLNPYFPFNSIVYHYVGHYIRTK